MRSATRISSSQPSIFLIIQYTWANACWLSVAMSTTQFIQDNKTRIENIDGNLDEAAITIMGESGRLEFYYFENGVLVNAKAKNTNLVKW